MDQRLDIGTARVALIANAKAGQKDAESRIEEIRARLAPRVAEFAIKPLRRGSEIAGTARDAANAGFDIIAALGGDGTQSAVAAALAGSRAVQAVLPGGTFNYLARELGVATMDEALDALLGGHVEARDLGQINDRLFVNNASLGLYPQILIRRESIYRRWGRSRIAAYWSVLREIRELRAPMRLTVIADGEEHHYRTPLAFIARSAYQLESLGLDGADAIRDGRFVLFLSKGHTRRALIAAAVRLALGQARTGTDFELVISDEIVVDSNKHRKWVALDGEKIPMPAPFRLKVLKGALRVCVPAPAARAEPDAA